MDPSTGLRDANVAPLRLGHEAVLRHKPRNLGRQDDVTATGKGAEGQRECIVLSTSEACTQRNANRSEAKGELSAFNCAG